MSFEARKPALRTGPAMREVKSSTVIAALGHEGSTLRVVYHSGKTYDYLGVSHAEFARILTAPSIDDAFRKVTLTNFTGRLVSS